MRLIRVFLCLFLILGALNLSFSEGYYISENDFVYFVSNSNPDVYINISSGEKELEVRRWVLDIDGEISSENVSASEQLILPYTVSDYSFNIDRELNESSNAFFELFVYDKDRDVKVVPQGDPVKFGIRYDDSLPVMLDYSFRADSSGSYLTMNFDEPIYNAYIYVNDEYYDSFSTLGPDLMYDSSHVIEVLFPEGMLENDFNEIEIVFEDFALNTASETINIYGLSDELSLDIITKKDDSSLDYYINTGPEFRELYDGTIYSRSRDFEFKFRTNKPARCYFLNGVISSNLDLDDANEPILMNSTGDNLVHSTDIDLDMVYRLWIVCEDYYLGEEVKYLGEELGFDTRLVKFEYYEKPQVSIEFYHPQNLITQLPASFFVQTNENAMCYYNIDNSEDVIMERENSSFVNFFKEGISIDEGSHKLDFECFDVMGDSDKVSNDIDVDESLGIKILEYSPKYSMSSSVDVEFTLSTIDAQCKYSDSIVAPTVENFEAMQPISNEDALFSFNYNPLRAGENSIYVYCSDSNQIYSPYKLEIIYDTKGVVLSDLKFKNGRYLSDYVSSYDELEFKFKVSSLIPVSYFNIEVEKENESLYFNISNDEDDINFTFEDTLDGDFEGAEKIKIVGMNMLNSSGSIEKNIRFDLTAPFVSLEGDTSKKIKCSDDESGCSDIFYGFSQIESCDANFKYNVSDSITFNSKPYLCVEAYNNVGLKTYKVFEFSADSVINESFKKDENMSDIINGNYSDDGDENGYDDEDYEENDGSDDPEDDPFDPTKIENPVEDEGSNIILIGAIILLVLGAGGGGYYAYKKGYLNKELERLGIHVGSKKNNDLKSSSNNAKSSNPVNFTSKPINPGNNVSKDESNLKSSKYDTHLKRLNKFIDDKVNKSKEVFDSFSSVPKGKVKGYEDTLAKKDSKSKDDLDFDEFYEKSKSNSSSNINSKKSLEEEADSFEKYYKDKKKKDSSEKKDSSKK